MRTRECFKSFHPERRWKKSEHCDPEEISRTVSTTPLADCANWNQSPSFRYDLNEVDLHMSLSIQRVTIILAMIKAILTVPSKMLTLAAVLLLAPFSVSTRPTSSANSSSTIQLIYEFSDFRLENLAPRSNDHLLLTASNQPYTYDPDPRASPPTPRILPRLSGVTSVLGIAETAPDVFAVAAGNYTDNFMATAGSFSVWSIDMNTPEPTVNPITAIPEAKAMNGLTVLHRFSSSVLIADSILGAIWKVDIATGKYSIAIQNSDFTPNNASLRIGINGLRRSGQWLYFTNTDQGTFGRIPISKDNGSAAGDVEIRARTTQSSDEYDDLDLDAQGNAYIATHPNAICVVTAAGTQTNITGDGSSFLQPTSARFGLGSEKGTLYVVTHGNATVSGQVVAINKLVS